jgi:hypothetical protein
VASAHRPFCDLASPISLTFLTRYPSPKDAQSLGQKRMQVLLASQHYSGRRTAAELVTRLRSAAEGRTGEAERNARRGVVLALVGTLGELVALIRALERQIARAVREHPDGQTFLSLFKGPDSTITAATLLAEIGDCRARYRTRDALAGDAGVARESGKRKVACFRWACNRRLRTAFDTLADSTRHWHPWAQDRYAAARARGHDHPRAIRTLGRARCRIVWRSWQDRVA